MAWVTQRTWTTGETITAAQLNVMVRDDLRFLYSPPSASAAHAQTQELQSQPGTSGNTDFIFDTTITDTDEMREITSADYPAILPTTALPTRFLKINSVGRYLLGASVCYPASPASEQIEEYGVSILRASDAAIIGRFRKGVAAVTTNPQSVAEISTLWDCAVGDLYYVTGPYSFGPGATQEMTFPFSYPAYPRFSAHWMGN